MRRENPSSYRQFYDTILARLKTIPIDAMLPTERALCEEYGYDRFNVRKALTLLAKEGYIERKQGSGTRVLRHTPSHSRKILFLLCQGARTTDRLGEPFYAQSVDALQERFQQVGMQLFCSKILCGENLADICQAMDAQALILAGAPDAAMLEQCRNLTIPVVGYNTMLAELPSVTTDNDGGVAAIVQHLMQLGHRHLGFIHVPGYMNSDRRLSRFKIEMRNANLNTKTYLHVAEGDWSEESGYRAAKELLAGDGPRPTAIFGGNDVMAIGVLRAAQELGLRVPEDLSLAGFDGLPKSSVYTPALSTAQVDLNTMAEATWMLLRHVMEFGMTRGMSATVAAEFVQRASTAKPQEHKG